MLIAANSGIKIGLGGDLLIDAYLGGLIGPN
jgi:hypothetical protein